MLRTAVSALSAVVCLGAPPLIQPAEAPRLPPGLTAEAVAPYYGCRNWVDPDARPVPSDESVTLKGARAVRRSGGVLHVGGRDFADASGEQEMDAVAWRYVGHLAGSPADVVYKRPYEGAVWLLVGAGEALELPGPPLSSPSGRAMAAAASHPAFEQSGLVIAEWTPAGLAVTARFPEVGWPCDLRWLGDDALALQAALGDGPGRWAPASVRREAGGWVYRGPSGR